jgi:hypothetical protein
MMKKLLFAGTLALLSVAGQHSASAGAITVGAGWYGFCFGASGSGATAGCQNDGIGVSGNDTTFTLTTSGELKVTDAFQKGDTFEIVVTGPTSGTFFTDVVPVDSSGSVTNPNIAFADPTYSHILIALSLGSYTVDVYANNSPYGGGGAYLSAAIPEPSTWAMMLAGFAFLGFAGYRKATTKPLAA